MGSNRASAAGRTLLGFRSAQHEPHDAACACAASERQHSCETSRVFWTEGVLDTSFGVGTLVGAGRRTRDYAMLLTTLHVRDALKSNAVLVSTLRQ